MAIPNNKIVIGSVIVGDSVGFIDLRSHLCNSGKLACCERLVIILLADFYGGRIDKTLNLKCTNWVNVVICSGKLASPQTFKILYFQLSTKISDYVDYWSISSTAVPGGYGIGINGRQFRKN